MPQFQRGLNSTSGSGGLLPDIPKKKKSVRQWVTTTKELAISSVHGEGIRNKHVLDLVQDVMAQN